MTEFNDINLPADFDDLSKHAPLLAQLRARGDGFVVPENYFSESSELSLATCHLSLVTDKDAGFIVPENYFEELSEKVISVVQLMEVKNENTFVVPENYFQNLTDEIISIANLSSLKNAETFDIPQDYFSELDSTLNTNLALDNLKQDEGFTVPKNYFEKFSDTLLSKISSDELKHGADEDVPSGYFDTLADRIADKIAKEESTLTNVSVEKNTERGRIIVFAEVLKRYARPASIAASVALVIGVSIWFFNHSSNGVDKNVIAKYNPVQKKEIQPIVIPLKHDSVVAPQPIAAITNDNSSKPVKHISHPRVNPQHDVVVKVEKKDIMDQLDILDVNEIADAVTVDNHDIKNQNDEFLNESMQDYLLNDNADPNELINPNQ